MVRSLIRIYLGDFAWIGVYDAHEWYEVHDEGESEHDGDDDAFLLHIWELVTEDLLAFEKNDSIDSHDFLEENFAFIWGVYGV